MLIFFRAGLLLLAGVVATAASAADVASTPAPAPVAAKSRDKVICRTDPVLGSRFEKKTCMTADQWRKQARENADDLDRRLRTPHVEQ